MLTILSFKWVPHQGYRSKFEAQHVNTLRNMLERHLHIPHELVCATDDPKGLDERIRVIPIWNDHANIPNPHGDRQPRCYRRLRLFARDAAELIGAERFAWIDLDVVLTGDVTPIFDRQEPIVLLPSSQPKKIPFNGSMLMMDAGAYPAIWDEFNPRVSPNRNKRANCWGSDQGQISYHLRDKGVAAWKIGSGGDGIYFWGSHLLANGGALPSDARLVSFHGQTDPWSWQAQRLKWVREHYR